VRLISVLTKAFLAILFVLRIIPLEPDHLTIAFESEDVGGNTIEEPAVVADDHSTSGEILDSFFKSSQGVDVEIVGRFIE